MFSLHKVIWKIMFCNWNSVYEDIMFKYCLIPIKTVWKKKSLLYFDFILDTGTHIR